MLGESGDDVRRWALVALDVGGGPAGEGEAGFEGVDLCRSA